MQNIFKIWREIKDIYLKYIDTGLPFKNAILEEERRLLFESGDAISKTPIIEFTPKYEEYKTLQDSCNILGLDTRFAEFAKRGLFRDRDGMPSKIYEHQFKSIKSAIVDRKHIVATTGTGSGKTECFLFPLIYDILDEKLNRNSKSSALRGLILYPLNALAEDQMRRLRMSLSSEAATAWLDEHASSNYITFGRYTGNTPFSGDRGSKNMQKMDKEKGELLQDWKNAKQYHFANQDEDYLYDTPNMDTRVEYWNRWEIQDTPPDILITNYSMLNIMLMREEEQDIFEQTRTWLQENTKNIFHLVIDELHTYRGTSGSEVAYLIRLLLRRLGLTPDSPQVQFLSSSASMQKGDRSKRYISNFFGVDEDQYDSKFELISDLSKKPVPYENKLNCRDFVNLISAEDDEIAKVFEYWDMVDRLKAIIIKPMEAEHILSELFEDDAYANQILALENILTALTKIKDRKGNAEQAQRAHYFFKNIDGLWACSNSSCSEVETLFCYNDRNIGKLYRRPQKTCGCGSLVLEVLTCRQCGEIYFNAWSNKNNRNKVSLDRGIDEKAYFNQIFVNKTDIDEDEDQSKSWRWGNFNHQNGEIEDRRIGGNSRWYLKSSEYKASYPHECISCGSKLDEKKVDENTLTPIHRHYTGVQKINQIMADTLLRILKKENPKFAKLVMFSDSRQAAAKLSAGIELDHYRDTVRSLLITEISEDTKAIALLKRKFEGERLSREENTYIRMVRSDYKHIRKLCDKIEEYLDDEGNQELHDDVVKGLIVENGFEITSIPNRIGEELLKLGINPGGPKHSLSKNNFEDNWHQEFDWENIKFIHNGDDQNLFNKIRKGLIYEILSSLLAGNRRSFESLGIGRVYATVNDLKGFHPDFINNCIKIMGENYRIYGGTNHYNGFPKKLWNYVRKVHGSSPSFKTTFLELLIENRIVKSENEVELRGEGLKFKYHKNSEPVYKWGV